MKKIILVGAGGHCKSCIDVIEKEKKFKIIGIIDNIKKGFFLKYKILGNDKGLKKYYKKTNYILISVGQIKNFQVRENLFNKIKKIKFKFATVVSPMSYVSKHAFIDEGSIIMHGSIINAGARIGKNCIINTKSLIEHDVTIGDYCHISTETTINGGVLIKKGTFIGSRSIIKNNISIGEGSIVGANLYINKNLKKNSFIKFEKK
jgi:sugar O-acyltransferase (sialic acid O-acetyltransferase NeuD family)